MQDDGISRVERSRNEARVAYNKISKYYDMFEGRWEERPKRIGLEMLDVRAGEKVLEIGFGTGHILLALARSVGTMGMVYGVDLAEKMVQMSESRVQRAQLSDRVELAQGDATALSYVPEYFDAALMSFVLELFDTPEIPVVLTEVRRVLKPGGRLLVVALAKRNRPSVRIYEWAHRMFPRTVDCRPIFVGRSLKEADFKIVDSVEDSITRLPVEIVLAKK